MNNANLTHGIHVNVNNFIQNKIMSNYVCYALEI